MKQLKTTIRRKGKIITFTGEQLEKRRKIFEENKIALAYAAELKRKKKEELSKRKNKNNSVLTPDIAGIYFLKHEGQTVYIGESNCIMARLGQHAKSKKVFDDYHWFEVMDCDDVRKRIERSLFNKHKPKYTKTLKRIYKKKPTHKVYGEKIIFLKK